MNLFLTGERDAGKTFIIEAALERWRAQGRGPVRGFRSYKEEEPDGAILIRFTSTASGAAVRTVARFCGGERTLYTEVFDTAGVAILAGLRPSSQGIVLMDELGFIESQAPRFQREVLRVLALPIPVLGVLRAQSLPFLDTIRARKDVTELTVTVDRREEAARECFTLLGLE